MIKLDKIEEAIKENMTDFYNGEYNLEVHSEDKAAQIKHIDNYLQSIKTRIEVQGKNGCYSGSPYRKSHFPGKIYRISPQCSTSNHGYPSG